MPVSGQSAGHAVDFVCQWLSFAVGEKGRHDHLDQRKEHKQRAAEEKIVHACHIGQSGKQARHHKPIRNERQY